MYVFNNEGQRIVLRHVMPSSVPTYLLHRHHHPPFDPLRLDRSIHFPGFHVRCDWAPSPSELFAPTRPDPGEQLQRRSLGTELAVTVLSREWDVSLHSAEHMSNFGPTILWGK